MALSTLTPSSLGEDEYATTVCVVGGPYVMSSGRRVDVPEGSKRLLVFVALRGGPVDRRRAAGALWPDAGEERAAGNVRSALWRLRGTGTDVLLADKSTLRLRQGTQVDIRSICDWAGRAIEGEVDSPPPSAFVLAEAVNLLPGWYDDWLIFERERIRQRILHGLEALSRHLARRQRWAEAVEAATTAVNVEPLRESAHRVLAEAHLAEGNPAKARRVVRDYRALVRAELGVDASAALTSVLPDGVDR